MSDEDFASIGPNSIKGTSDQQFDTVLWTGDGKDIWISCYDQYSSKCVFVLKPEKIISKYMQDMEYTDFANGEVRWKKYCECK